MLYLRMLLNNVGCSSSKSDGKCSSNFCNTAVIIASRINFDLLDTLKREQYVLIAFSSLSFNIICALLLRFSCSFLAFLCFTNNLLIL